jgi:hypothetical protein
VRTVPQMGWAGVRNGRLLWPGHPVRVGQPCSQPLHASRARAVISLDRVAEEVVTAANNVRLDADRDEHGHADRFWALALASHAADDFKLPLPASLARKPVGW